jgi:aminoglycoside phosphotransferase (APT) family kinase protein
MRADISPPISFDPAAHLVARTLLPAPANVAARRLAGGYQNDVFRVQGHGIDWVVKLFRPQTELTLFPNDAAAEARALAQLGVAGLAPRFVDFAVTASGPVLVYEFYAGPTWHGGEVASVAAMLARLHKLPARGFRAVAQTPQAIIDDGRRFLEALDDTESRQLLCALLPAPIDLPAAPPSLIHTDAGPGNIVLGADGLRLIDWQCPALGDPGEDIAAFLSPAFQILYGCAPLEAAQRDAFLHAYEDEVVTDRFRRLEPFFAWRMAAYCAWRAVQYGPARPQAAAGYRLALEALVGQLRERSWT